MAHRSGNNAAAGDQLQLEGISRAWLHLLLHDAVPAQGEALAGSAAVVGWGGFTHLFVSLKLIAASVANLKPWSWTAALSSIFKNSVEVETHVCETSQYKQTVWNKNSEKKCTERHKEIFFYWLGDFSGFTEVEFWSPWKIGLRCQYFNFKLKLSEANVTSFICGVLRTRSQAVTYFHSGGRTSNCCNKCHKSFPCVIGSVCILELAEHGFVSFAYSVGLFGCEWGNHWLAQRRSHHCVDWRTGGGLALSLCIARLDPHMLKYIWTECRGYARMNVNNSAFELNIRINIKMIGCLQFPNSAQCLYSYSFYFIQFVVPGCCRYWLCMVWVLQHISTL